VEVVVPQDYVKGQTGLAKGEGVPDKKAIAGLKGANNDAKENPARGGVGMRERRVLSRNSPSRSPPARRVLVAVAVRQNRLQPVAAGRFNRNRYRSSHAKARTSAALWESLKGFNC
jgi:hypothetical protein